MSGFRSAVSLLTRVPVGAVGPPTGDSAAWFPVVGALVGALVAGVYAIGYAYMPSLLAAALAVVIGILVTGAFHEDGLADSADALGSRATGEEALRVMRDSRVGAYGAIALMVTVLWRVVAVASLSPRWALAGLVTAHALARTGPVALMAFMTPARSDGLGRAGALAVNVPGVVVASVIGIGLTAVALGAWGLAALTMVALACSWVGWRGLRAVGGITGDILGAAEQLGEMLVLGVVAVAAWQGSELWWMS